MLRLWPALLLTPALLVWPFSRKDRLPPHPLIGVAYYHCPKCNSLHGGLWGKGKPRRFNGPNRKHCVHDWHEISGKEFKALATKLHGYVWKRDEDTAKAKVWIEARGGTADVELQKDTWPTIIGVSFRGVSQADVALEEMRGLAGLHDWWYLRRLDLGHSAITDKGLRSLQNARDLQVLLLGETAIGDDGLIYLNELGQLRELSLAHTQVTDAGLRHLSGMSKLQTLDLTGTRVTDAGVRRFHQELPKVKVIR